MKKILFTLFLAAALTGARGQIYIDSYRFAEPSECGGLLLDSDCMPSAKFAISLRKLRTDYTGDCVEVRNDSTGRSFNIGFVNNFLDTTRLKDSCAAQNCFVVKWYDQSGLAKDAVQNTNSMQPQIISNGALYRENGIVSVRFGQNSGTGIVMQAGSEADWKFLHDGTNHTKISIAKPTTVQGEATFYTLASTVSGNNYSTSIGFTSTYDNRPSISRGNLYYDDMRNGTTSVLQNSADTGTVSVTNMHSVISFLYPSNATANQRAYTYVDNNAEFNKNTSTGTPSSSNPTFTLYIGKYGDSDGGRFRGYISELIFHDIDYKSKVQSIKTNINNIYNLW